jgi:hypothetical protein
VGTGISGNLSLPADTSIYSYSPYLDVTADEAYVGATLSFSGYLEYNIGDSGPSQLYIDIDTILSAEVALTLEVGAPYSDTFEYSPGELTYALIDVPGILQLGPALGFGIGVSLDAQAAVTVTADLSLGIPDGGVHFDFVDYNNTSASGWTPVYSATANVTEAAEVTVTPFITITTELMFNVLDGLLDLSAGITMQPSFPNDFTLTATQSTGGDASTAGDGTCADGLSILSTFDFSVNAFVTEFWAETLYSVEVPVADECYSWL